jgi:hypothetical protein
VKRAGHVKKVATNYYLRVQLNAWLGHSRRSLLTLPGSARSLQSRFRLSDENRYRLPNKTKLNDMKQIIPNVLGLLLGVALVHTAVAQEILPFPQKQSGSIAGRTMQESVYSPLPEPKHLRPDAPNILIVLIDDVGPAQTDTYGGEIHTPTLSRIAKEGISYNRFHTTAMCSPTRAALLTGRNHHRVSAGQIAELANDWDGYSGIQPKSSAMVAEVLKDYGYSTSAFGKWHNTPAEQTTAAGPFDYWPTGYGFEYFYGFLGGEASQYEPNMVRNTSPRLSQPARRNGVSLLIA